MSQYSPNPKSEFVDEKRKLLYWIAQWPNEEVPCEDITYDIPEMSVMLQSMGFRLETFQKALDVENVPIIQNCCNMADKNMMRVDLTCPKSGMRSCLVKQTANCKCPAEEELDKGQFWSVTGCGPSSQNSIDTSNSSLLPTITSAKTKIIKALLSKVIAIINGTETVEKQEILEPFKNTYLLGRHRSLDTLKNNNDSFLSPRGLKRRPSWEVDPKTSPPTQTSSPVPNLCNSLGRISLSSGQTNTVVKNLEAIKKLVEEALDIAGGSNATFVKSGVPTKRVSDIKPPNEASGIKEPSFSVSPKASPSTPRKLFTPKKYNALTADRKENMPPPSRIATLRKKTPIMSHVSSATVKIVRRDTPRPKTVMKAAGGSCESIFKHKTPTAGTRVGLSPKAISTGAGPSGVAKTKTAPKQASTTPLKKKI